MTSQYFNLLKIPALYFIVVLILSAYHTTFEEWDGVMQYFAGSEIFSGEGYNGWTSHFWPPLSSVLIGFLSKFMSGFAAGKLVSILSAIAVLIFIYLIVIELIDDKPTAFLTQVFIALNPMFVLSSIQVENHMLDTSFFVGSIYFLIKLMKQPESNTNIINLAIFTGFATLSRYTSYTLIPLIAIVFIFAIHKKYLSKNSLIFITLFLLVNAPWYYYNFRVNGSPLYTWQYMNIGSHVYPGSSLEWWWSKQADYSSISQIIIDYPNEYLKNFIKNLLVGSILLFMSIGPVFLLFIVHLVVYNKNLNKIDLVMLFKNKFLLILVIGYLGYLALVSQAFVFDQVFLSWTVLFTATLFMFMYKLTKKQYSNKIHFLIIAMMTLSVMYTGIKVYKYCNNFDDGGQLSSYKKIAEVLANEENINQSYIMAINPARAYYSNSNFLMVPLYFKGTVNELVSYYKVPHKVKEYLPKYPAKTKFENMKADYLIYGPSLRKTLPQYKFLLDSKSSKIPSNFHLIYQDNKVVVYKIKDQH